MAVSVIESTPHVSPQTRWWVSGDIAEERRERLRRCTPAKLRWCASQTATSNLQMFKCMMQWGPFAIVLTTCVHRVDSQCIYIFPTWVPKAYISAGVPSMPTAVTNVTSIDIATGTVANLKQNHSRTCHNQKHEDANAKTWTEKSLSLFSGASSVLALANPRTMTWVPRCVPRGKLIAIFT